MICGLLLMLVTVYPIYKIKNLKKHADLAVLKGIVIVKKERHESKGSDELILTLKNYNDEFYVSDLAYKQA